MTTKPALIIGARSDIGRAVAHKFAALGHPIQLAARNVLTLAADQSDLELRYGVTVTLHELDALKLETHQSFVEELPELPEVAVTAVGLMGDQKENERDVAAACQVILTNFEGPASLFAVLANAFEQRGSGTLVGISSVAGDRGRATNYVYGSAKAGFTTFLSGLRNRLSKRGVHVVTVLPGFVATQMTKDIDLPKRLTAQPSEVAAAIAKAVGRKNDIIYVRPVWRCIMLIIRNIPESVFKRLEL